MYLQRPILKRGETKQCIVSLKTFPQIKTVRDSVCARPGLKLFQTGFKHHAKTEKSQKLFSSLHPQRSPLPLSQAVSITGCLHHRLSSIAGCLHHRLSSSQAVFHHRLSPSQAVFHHRLSSSQAVFPPLSTTAAITGCLFHRLSPLLSA